MRAGNLPVDNVWINLWMSRQSGGDPCVHHGMKLWTNQPVSATYGRLTSENGCAPAVDKK